MNYDALDDVPWQVKSRRQQQQQQQNSSPTFSIITDSSSPQQPGHNRQNLYRLGLEIIKVPV